jgi:DnaJ family protein A protein 2
MTQHESECANCHGTGSVFKEKDRCKKCRGACVVEVTELLELYVPPGAREGDKIVLAGEADQHPDQEPGDIVFHIVEVPHDRFTRRGADLQADITVSLAEALLGFERVVLTHLDGRGISISTAASTTQPKPRILRPDQVLKVEGEGMPIKKSAARGALYLVVKIAFPTDDWQSQQDAASASALRAALPGPAPEIKADVVDDVEYDAAASLEGFGASGGGDAGDPAWTDDDDDDDEGSEFGLPGLQCPTQ